MHRINDSKDSSFNDTRPKDNNSDNDVDYKNSSEIENPHPSTATPNIPDEMPAQENT